MLWTYGELRYLGCLTVSFLLSMYVLYGIVLSCSFLFGACDAWYVQYLSILRWWPLIK